MKATEAKLIELLKALENLEEGQRTGCWFDGSSQTPNDWAVGPALMYVCCISQADGLG